MHKSVPKVPKVLTFRKVPQKIQTSGGVSDLFWIKSKFGLSQNFAKKKKKKKGIATTIHIDKDI